MSKLWYEARDAIDNEKYLKASNRTLRKYFAELSIVQPWESDQKCIGAVDKKHSMMNKLKKEIERRNQKFRADVREFLFRVSIAVTGSIIALFAWSKIGNKTYATKETDKLQPSTIQATKNQQSRAAVNYSASKRLPPSKKLD